MNVAGMFSIETEERDRMSFGQFPQNMVAPNLAARIGRGQSSSFNPKNFHEADIFRRLGKAYSVFVVDGIRALWLIFKRWISQETAVAMTTGRDSSNRIKSISF